MRDKTGIERPWLFRGIRATEMLGLLTVMYGLASSEWLTVAAGAVVIVTSYRVYRNWFPALPLRDGGSIGMGDGDD